MVYDLVIHVSDTFVISLAAFGQVLGLCTSIEFLLHGGRLARCKVIGPLKATFVYPRILDVIFTNISCR